MSKLLRPFPIGVMLMTLSGAGILLYGFLQLLRTFAGWIEFGLSPVNVGATPQAIQAFSPQLFDYISHIQVAASGLLMAFGFTIIGLSWFGIRKGLRWALWTAAGGHLVAYLTALPLHFVYGLATPGHVGPVYLDIAFVLASTLLCHRSVK